MKIKIKDFKNDKNIKNLVELVRNKQHSININKNILKIFSISKKMKNKFLSNNQRINFLINCLENLSNQIILIITSNKFDFSQSIKINKFKYQIDSNPENLKYLVTLLERLITKIQRKELFSIRKLNIELKIIDTKLKFSKNIRPSFKKFLKNIRSALIKFLGFDLILFNITQEPFGDKDLNDKLYDDLRKCLVDKFEPPKKKFICKVFKKLMPLSEVWDKKIHKGTKETIERHFLKQRTRLGMPKTQAKKEFNSLVQAFNLNKLLLKTLFSFIGIIIAENWIDFKLYYPNFFTKNYFRKNFDKLTSIRDTLAHPEEKRIDLLEFLSNAGSNLSDILEFLFQLKLAIQKV